MTSELNTSRGLFAPDAVDHSLKRLVPTLSSIDVFTETDFNESATNVNISEELARGSYGVVYKGTTISTSLLALYGF